MSLVHFTVNANYLVKEDRIWQYIYAPHSSFDYVWSDVFELKFDGNETINNIEYSKLMLKKHISILHPDKIDFNNVELLIENTDFVVAYIREDTGIVYMCYPENIMEYYRKIFYNSNSEYMLPEDKSSWKESQLYNFNVEAGESFIGITYGHDEEELIEAKFIVDKTSEIEMCGQKCRVIYNDHIGYIDNEVDLPTYPFYYSVIEGVGFEGVGTMTFIPLDITTNGDPKLFLNYVYDENYNVIYEGVGDDLSKLNPVIEIGINNIHYSEKFHIVKSDGNKIIVMNTLGKEVATGNGTVSINGLPPGVYCAVAYRAGAPLSVLKFKL